MSKFQVGDLIMPIGAVAMSTYKIYIIVKKNPYPWVWDSWECHPISSLDQKDYSYFYDKEMVKIS